MSTHSISPQQDQQRQDQIVHRFYIKTVEVLIEARLANVNGGDATERKVSVQTEDGHLVGATSPVSKSKKELRIDKWFNLPLPDPEIFRPDLEAYRSLSLSYPATTSAPYAIVPPLLIAFILDVSDLPPKHALAYRRSKAPSGKEGDDAGGEVLRLDLPGSGTGKEGKPKGIVLERWTLKSLSIPSIATPTTSTSTSPLNSISSSSTFVRPSRDPSKPSQPAQTTPYPSSSASYKSGIIHFRSLYQYVRLLPAFDVYQRTRRGRANRPGSRSGGLKVGIKLWSAEGYEDEWVREGDDCSDNRDDDYDTDEEFNRGRQSPTYRRRTPEEGLKEAWTKMEEGLIGLDEPIEAFCSPVSGPALGRQDQRSRDSYRGGRAQGDAIEMDEHAEEKLFDYEFPTLPLSHGLFSLAVRAREDVDIWAEDVESLLSTALAGSDPRSRDPGHGRSHGADGEGEGVDGMDLEEEYFTPTLTAKRKVSGDRSTGMAVEVQAPVAFPLEKVDMGDTGVAAMTSGLASIDLARKPARPRRVISESQVGSGAGLGLDAPAGSRAESPGSPGRLEISGVGMDLPFAVSLGAARDRGGVSATGSGPSSFSDRPRTADLRGHFSTSPLAGLGIARRQSNLSREGESGPQHAASPSSLGNRSSPLTMGFRTSSSNEARPSSLQRTSPYLSSSGRSFTQLSESRPRVSSLTSNLALPGTSPSRASFRGSSNLSPSSGSIPRSATLARPSITGHHSTPTPPIPEYHEEENGPGIPVPLAPQSLKRYSSSFGQRRSSFNLGITPGAASSNGSSLDPGSLLAAGGHSMSRTNTRLSGSSRPPSFSNAPDNDAIAMFLRTLDSMPRPPSIANAPSRAYLPSTSSSLSNPRHSVLATPEGMAGSAEGSGPPSVAESTTASTGAFRRKRMTKSQATEALNNMASSYTLAAQPFAQPGSSPLTGSALATSNSVSPIDRLIPSALRAATGPRNTIIPSDVGERHYSDDSLRSVGHTGPGREPGLTGRLASSVKSSSPLTQAPLQASSQRNDPQANYRIRSDRETKSPVNPESFALPDQQLPFRPTGNDTLLYTDRHVQSLPGDGSGVGLSRNHSLPAPSPDSRERVDITSHPVLIGSERDSRRRMPVLQRGGFGQLMSMPSDNASVPSVGITSISVGGAADNNLGVTAPGSPAAKKISRSAPGRDALGSPKGIPHSLLHVQNAPAIPAMSLGSLQARVLEGAGSSYGCSRMSQQNALEHNSRPAMPAPSMIRALSGDPSTGGLRRQSATNYQRAPEYQAHACATAPASPNERIRATDRDGRPRRWISETDYLSERQQRMDSRRLSVEGEGNETEESVVGDMEMSDHNTMLDVQEDPTQVRMR